MSLGATARDTYLIKKDLSGPGVDNVARALTLPVRRRRGAHMARTTLPGVLLGLVLVIAGCSSAGPSALPPAPGYQARLDRTDHDIAGAFSAIGHAKDPSSLADSVLAASGTVNSASQWLASAGPVPQAAVPTNNALVGSMGQFATQLSFLSNQISQQAICTGSTALGAITTAPSMNALRTEAGQLAGFGYHWGAFLPAPRDQSDARMPTGRLVQDRRSGQQGNGVLRVTNNGDTDAVVTLAKGGNTVVGIAVQAGQSTELDSIPDGSYDVYYLTGTDWDDVVHMFGRGCQFHRFTGPSTFTSTPVSSGTAYTVQTITVSTTSGDDAPDTSTVQPDGLPR